MSLTIVNTTTPATITGSASGSFTIPASTSGNLLVVLASMTAGSLVHPTLTITDNVGDTFSNPAWSTLSTTDAGAGQMYRFSGGSGGLHFYDDCAYATTNGAATTITWSLANAGSAGSINIEFFVYEVSGFSIWALADFEAAGVSNASLGSTNYPYVGPTLNSTNPDSAYFATCNIAFSFASGGGTGAIVNTPWSVTSPTPGSNNAVGHIQDSSGSQQPTFTRGGGSYQTNYQVIGVVFTSGSAPTTIGLTSTGTVDHIGAAQAFPTTYSYITPEIVELDPSTSAAWTPSGMSATLFGAKFS